MTVVDWRLKAAIRIREEADRLAKIATEFQELSSNLHEAASETHHPPIGKARYLIRIVEDRIEKMELAKLADRLCDIRNIDMRMNYDFTNPRFSVYRPRVED